MFVMVYSGSDKYQHKWWRFIDETVRDEDYEQNLGKHHMQE